MKKLLIVCIVLIFSFNTIAQVELRTPKEPTGTGEFKPLPKTVFSVNPLGVLQFGPIGQAEFRVGEKSYATAHVRLPYLGVLYHVINIDWESEESRVSPLALGIGGGYKTLFPNSKGAWYFGGVTDLSFGSSSGDDGSEWKSSFANVALMGNGGFRWRSPIKNSFLALGGYVGVVLPLKNEWWYKISPDDRDDERMIIPMAMLELTFGWER